MVTLQLLLTFKLLTHPSSMTLVDDDLLFAAGETASWYGLLRMRSSQSSVRTQPQVAASHGPSPPVSTLREFAKLLPDAIWDFLAVSASWWVSVCHCIRRSPGLSFTRLCRGVVLHPSGHRSALVLTVDTPTLFLLRLTTCQNSPTGVVSSL